MKNLVGILCFYVAVRIASIGFELVADKELQKKIIEGYKEILNELDFTYTRKVHHS